MAQHGQPHGEGKGRHQPEARVHGMEEGLSPGKGLVKHQGLRRK